MASAGNRSTGGGGAGTTKVSTSGISSAATSVEVPRCPFGIRSEWKSCFFAHLKTALLLRFSRAPISLPE
jgi:hypothetical protein